MFKHFLAALAAACLLLVILWAFGAGVPIPKPIGWAVVLAIGLWSAWPLLRHISGRTIAFLGLGLLAVSLSACNTLGGIGAPGGGNIQQVVANVKAFNDAAANGPCVGYGNIDWQPPLPPAGALHVQCFIGNQQVMSLKQFAGSGGNFGGGGATGTAPAALAPAAAAPAESPK